MQSKSVVASVIACGLLSAASCGSDVQQGDADVEDPIGTLAPAEPEAKEAEKIDGLIKHVESLDGATFIRNGSSYDAKNAAKFLRAKYDRDKEAIKTAEEFIDKIATKSSISGKPYTIRFKDGKESESGPYLIEQLGKM